MLKALAAGVVTVLVLIALVFVLVAFLYEWFLPIDEQKGRGR